MTAVRKKCRRMPIRDRPPDRFVALGGSVPTRARRRRCVRLRERNTSPDGGIHRFKLRAAPVPLPLLRTGSCETISLPSRPPGDDPRRTAACSDIHSRADVKHGVETPPSIVGSCRISDRPTRRFVLPIPSAFDVVRPPNRRRCRCRRRRRRRRRSSSPSPPTRSRWVALPMTRPVRHRDIDCGVRPIVRSSTVSSRTSRFDQNDSGIRFRAPPRRCRCRPKPPGEQ
jgi:hypothetical protein